MSCDNEPKLKKPATWSTRLLFLAWILTLIFALVGTKILYDHQEHLQNQWDDWQQHQQRDTLRLQQDLDTLKTQQISTDKKITQLQSMISSVASTQESRLFQVREDLVWAQLNAHDPLRYTTSILFLNQADLLLQGHLNDDLTRIQEAIHTDRDTLLAQHPVSIDTFLSPLDWAQTMILSLPLTSPQTSPAIHANASPSLPHWLEPFKNSLHQLAPLLIIQHHDTTIQPLQTAAQTRLMYEQIQFELQTAQWAVLSNNPALYTQSLAHAIQFIQKTFDCRQSSTLSVLNTLNTLKNQTNTLHASTVVLTSLPALNAFMQTQDIRAPTSAGVVHD